MPEHDPNDIYNEEAYLALVNQFDREKEELKRELEISRNNELTLWRLVGPQLMQQLKDDSGG